MPRRDLLALSDDDLSALTNRGTVKRARREVEAGEFTCQLDESEAGEVVAVWSDSARCLLPAGKTVSEGRCSCSATTLCRHLVRTVMQYQRKLAASAPAAPTPRAPVGGVPAGGATNDPTGAAARDAAALAAIAPAGPWDPGSISDEELQKHFKKTVLSAAAARLREGLLVELVRGSKPTARFHQLAFTLRFVVPHDIRYTHCDCAEPAPCSHVPLAVWAFRRLAPEKSAGIVSTQETAPPAPLALLDDVEAALAALAQEGIATLPPSWKDRMARLELHCQQEQLVWPAEVLAELIQQYERYAGHNALFSPQRVAELAGEALIRLDAIRSATPAVPQLLVRGTATDRATEIGSARYIGLGCGARQLRGGAELTSYFQDADSGTIVTIAREFADPEKESKAAPRDFWQLAQTSVVRGITLGAAGAGQLLVQGGKRSPDRRLVVGRARASLNPQAYAWETLRPPALVEGFAELRARLGGLPPASLRPRYVAEDFHVCPLAQVIAAHFNAAAQTIEAEATDAAGESAWIVCPYHSRAREGTEALLAALADPLRRPCFVAGPARLAARGVVVNPVMLVLQAGPHRVGVQPAIDRMPDSAGSIPAIAPDVRPDPVTDLPAELVRQLGQLLLLGLRRADGQVARTWQELARHAESVGYDRLARVIARLADALARKAASLQWDAAAPATAVLELTVLAKLAQDIAA